MTTSMGRGAVAGRPESTSRGARAIRHPFWTLGTVVRGLAAAPGPALLGRAVHHLFKRTFPLRLTVPARRWSETVDDAMGVRWAGPINLRHRTLEALFCHAPAGVEYRTKAPAGSRFVVECGLSPEVWLDNPPPITFTVNLEVPAANGWRGHESLVLDPGTRWTDRRWRQVAFALPPVEGAAVDVVVTLSTALAGPGKTANAWSLFGEPRFETRRTPTAIWGSIVTFAGRLRSHGVGAAFELLRVTGIATQDAETYSRWVVRNTRSDTDLSALAARVAALPVQPLISVIVPVYNTDPKWLRRAIESVRQQVYPRWELCICDDASPSAATRQTLEEYRNDERIRITLATENRGISGASNAALATARGDFIALLDHDDEFTPDALAEVVTHINAHPAADVFYSDEDKLDLRGERCDPYFKPDWSPEHFHTTMYTCHLMVIRRTVLDAVAGFRAGYEGAQDYDLLLRIADRGATIHHIPRILYHWRKLPESTASASQAKPWALDAGRKALEDHVRRNEIGAEVLSGGAPGLYRIRRGIRGKPLVSIVIPTAGRPRDVRGTPVDMLAAGIRSVVEKTDYDRYEFIVVADPAGLLPSTERALAGTEHQVLRFERPGRFNFSAKINAGAAASKGEHVLLFNDDLEVITPEWLSAMVEYSQEPEIGAVGPKLLYPDGRLQHVGMVLGVAGVAAHAFHQHPGVSPGYAGSAIMVRNYSAVTGACLMTRRALFDEMGRLDEWFPVDFNDVDYCLRLRHAGYRIVYTPWAQLYHHESASFGLRRQDLDALAEMRRRWSSVIDNDPYYNPNLTRDFPDYRLDG